jgi:polysaccharide export outer membrane protein
MDSKKCLCAFVLIVLVFAVPFLFCQTGAENKDRAKEQSLNDRLNEIKKRNDSKLIEDYRLGPSDVIEISVFNIKELNKTLEVTAQGKVTLPFLGEIQVEGLTAQELEKKLESLLDARVMRNPQVSVTIRERHSQPIHILGAVQKPGTYQLARRINLIDALSLVGGFSEKAGDKIYLRKASTTHPATLNGETQASQKTIEVDIKDLLVVGDEKSNYVVEAGDVISVPVRVEKVYYVLGDVGRPGAYEFKEKDETVRFSQALASAGGVLNTAALKDAIVVRQAQDGKKTHIPVNIKNVLKGSSEDLMIKPNDLIFVPNSASKQARQAILNGLSGIITAGMVVAK